MKTFTVGQRVEVRDSSSGALDTGTVERVWPNYSGKPEEKGCYDIRLDKPWSGNTVEAVMRIGRTEATMRAVMLLLCLLAVACNQPPKPPVAAPAPGKSASPVPAAITEAHAKALAAIAAAEAKLTALEAQAATASAQVESARIANGQQPPAPATVIVEKETALALGNLPPPDVKAALAAEQRRAAMFAGQADEARKLYAAAQTETERMKSEAARLRAEADTAKAKASEANAALVAAEKSHVAALERNRAENQAKLDDLAARLKKSEDDRKNAETKEQVKWLRIIGLACLVAGIGIGVMTNGLQLAKSIGFGACALACFGLAQIVAHRFFLPVSIGVLVLAACGGAYWFWREREDALKKSAMEKQVAELEKVDLRAVPTTDDKGRPSNIAIEFDRVMDKPEKAVVKKLVFAKTVKEAKAEAKA